MLFVHHFLHNLLQMPCKLGIIKVDSLVDTHRHLEMLAWYQIPPCHCQSYRKTLQEVGELIIVCHPVEPFNDISSWLWVRWVVSVKIPMLVMQSWKACKQPGCLWTSLFGAIKDHGYAELGSDLSIQLMDQFLLSRLLRTGSQAEIIKHRAVCLAHLHLKHHFLGEPLACLAGQIEVVLQKNMVQVVTVVVVQQVGQGHVSLFLLIIEIWDSMSF